MLAARDDDDDDTYSDFFFVCNLNLNSTYKQTQLANRHDYNPIFICSSLSMLFIHMNLTLYK